MPTPTNGRALVRPTGAAKALFLAIAAGIYLCGSVAQAAGWPESQLRALPFVLKPRAHRTSASTSARSPGQSPLRPLSEPVDPITDQNFNDCKRPAAGKRIVPVGLKPDTDVTHLILWISSITCKSFVWSGGLAVGNRKVTVVVPALVTREQAFQLFLDALNSVGLTLQPSDGFSQIIETARAKSKPIPLYDWQGHLLTGGRS